MEDVLEQEILQRRLDAVRGDLDRLMREARELSLALADLTGETHNDAAAPSEQANVVDESDGHVGDF